ISVIRQDQAGPFLEARRQRLGNARFGIERADFSPLHAKLIAENIFREKETLPRQIVIRIDPGIGGIPDIKSINASGGLQRKHVESAFEGVESVSPSQEIRQLV